MPSDRSEPEFVPLTSYREYPPDEMLRRARDFAADMQRRRTVRQFSDLPVPREIIERCLETAGTAPSGAHQQPWHFVAVSDPALKHAIREAAEQAESAFYQTAPVEWLSALAPERWLDVLGRNRSFGDDLARRSLLHALELLEGQDELVHRYRRRMMALLH